jgi:hypothetical protein
LSKLARLVWTKGGQVLLFSYRETNGSQEKDQKMKLNATNIKVQIKWFAILHDGSKMRNSQGFVHNAWDVECSCGWATHTGGAIKASVMRDVVSHKITQHNYTYKVGA